MGKKASGMSKTQTNRMISASNAARKEQERISLINSQIGLERERIPQYRIEEFNFNEETRVARICFLEIKEYRKIVKYVTQNGQRYPIYGGWNTKTKRINQTIKLTNEVLENLRENDDPLVSLFSEGIIALIDNEMFYPSWYVIDALKNDEKEEIDSIKKSFEEKNESERICLRDLNDRSRETACRKAEKTKQLENYRNSREYITRSIEKAKKRKYMVFFSIITFGIYAYLHSNSRIQKLIMRLQSTLDTITEIENEIAAIDKTIQDLKMSIDEVIDRINCNSREEKDKIIATESNYSARISAVESLPSAITDVSEHGFIPLKKLCGMNYERIIGCYVIHNIENDKYYVGQSKDVIRRICKQHFDGTKVRNIIFAEDYYNSHWDNKEDLFEVRIIRLSTKDELDETEKRLIEEYDSFNNGYNGTAGNK